MVFLFHLLTQYALFVQNILAMTNQAHPIQNVHSVGNQSRSSTNKFFESLAFHGSVAEDSVILAYDAVPWGNWFQTFRRKIVPSSSTFKGLEMRQSKTSDL